MDDALKLQVFFQTLGDANRLRIIKFIGDRECSVSEIVKATGLSQPLVSHHLRAMRNSQILETERKGPFIYYKLKDKKLMAALGMVSEIVHGMDERPVKSKMFCCPPWWNMAWDKPKGK